MEGGGRRGRYTRVIVYYVLRTTCPHFLQAMRNTKMVAAYASIDERVKILGYAIKHFAKVSAFSLRIFFIADCVMLIIILYSISLRLGDGIH